jgi:hypothetical protein
MKGTTMATPINSGMTAAGRVIRAAHERRGLNVTQAAALFGMSRDVLNRIYRGDARIQAMWLRKIEGEFGWPTMLLTKVIEGDTKWIKATPMDEDVRRVALDVLGEARKSDVRASTSQT